MNADILFDLDRASSSSTSSCRPSAFSNAKAQRRKDEKPTHPPIWPTDHTDKHRWNHDFWLCVARSRPSNDGRVPLGRDTDSNVNVRHGVPTQRPALDERRPRHLSSSFNGWKAHTPHYNNTEERQNRRANSTSAGEKRCDDKRSRSEFASFSPATGDPRSPVVLPPINGTVFQAQHLPLCVGGWVVGLRVFVSSWLRRASWADLCDLWAVLSVPSVPLWFCRCFGDAKALSALE